MAPKRGVHTLGEAAGSSDIQVKKEKRGRLHRRQERREAGKRGAVPHQQEKLPGLHQERLLTVSEVREGHGCK